MSSLKTLTQTKVFVPRVGWYHIVSKKWVILFEREIFEAEENAVVTVFNVEGALLSHTTLIFSTV